MAQTVCPDGNISDAQGNCPSNGMPMTARFPSASSLGIATPSREAVANLARKGDERTQTAALAAEAIVAERNRNAEVKRAQEEAVSRVRAAPRAAEAPHAYDTLISPDGSSTIIVTPNRSAEYLNQGYRYRKPGEEQPFAKARRDLAAGAPGRSLVAGPPTTPPPVSEQLANMPYQGNAPEQGRTTSWTFNKGFSGPYAHTTSREYIGGRLEQSEDWRKYRDARVKELQGEEAAAGSARTAAAQSEQAVEAAKLDPYEMARIRAQGQYGGEAIKARAESAARHEALAQVIPIFEQAMNATDPNQRKQLMEIGGALANILLGQRVTQSPQDWMSLLLGQGLLGGAVTAAGASPPK